MRDNIYCGISMIVSFGISYLLLMGGLIPPADTLRKEALIIFILFMVVFVGVFSIITKVRNTIHRSIRRRNRIDRMFHDFEKLRRN